MGEDWGWGSRTPESSRPEGAGIGVATPSASASPDDPGYSLFLALEVQHRGGSQVPKRFPRAVQVPQWFNSVALQWPTAAWRGRQRVPSKGVKWTCRPNTPQTGLSGTSNNGQRAFRGRQQEWAKEGAPGTAAQALGQASLLLSARHIL